MEILQYQRLKTVLELETYFLLTATIIQLLYG